MSGFYDDGGVAFVKEQFDNARKRRDHLERYNKEVAAGSWVHKHKVGAFNR